MKFLVKIEDLINKGLIWLSDRMMIVLAKLIPPSLNNFWGKIKLLFQKIVLFIKGCPAKVKSKLSNPKELIKIDYKGVFTQALDAGKTAFQKSKDKSPIRAALHAFSMPFIFLFKWANTLKPAHFVILFVFTTASIFSVLGIVVSSKSILKEEDGASRFPASDPADTYSRPDYYKKNEREVTFNNVKIPVYVEGINELRSVIIDFSVTASNRSTRRWLEIHEFELRDHLVSTLEPVMPTFPMTDEGRSMLAEKLKNEVTDFLSNHKVEGSAKEVRIVYILAH